MKHPCTVVLLLTMLSACQPDSAPSKEKTALLSSSGELVASTRWSAMPPVVRGMWQYSIRQMAPERALVKQGEVILAFEDAAVKKLVEAKSAELINAKQELANRKLQDEKQAEELKIALAEKNMFAERDQRKVAIVDQSRSELERKKMQLDSQISQNDQQLAAVKLTKQAEQAQAMQNMLAGRVVRLEQELTQLQNEQSSMTLKAPFTGVISYQSNFSGDKFSVGDEAQFGQPVLELSQLDSLQVKAAVDEVHLSKISGGMRVQIHIDAIPDQVFVGTVQPVKTVVRDKSYTDRRRVFDVDVAFANADPKLMRPGMTARLQFEEADSSKAPAIGAP